MQRNRVTRHKYEISHLKMHAIAEWPSRTLKVIAKLRVVKTTLGTYVKRRLSRAVSTMWLLQLYRLHDTTLYKSTATAVDDTVFKFTFATKYEPCVPLARFCRSTAVDERVSGRRRCWWSCRLRRCTQPVTTPSQFVADRSAPAVSGAHTTAHNAHVHFTVTRYINSSSQQTCLTATGTHTPYGITRRTSHSRLYPSQLELVLYLATTEEWKTELT